MLKYCRQSPVADAGELADHMASTVDASGLVKMSVSLEIVEEAGSCLMRLLGGMSRIMGHFIPVQMA